MVQLPRDAVPVRQRAGCARAAPRRGSRAAPDRPPRPRHLAPNNPGRLTRRPATAPPARAARFFKWFDYMSWYPLGRPVGTTIYPGMQMTSVALYHALDALGLHMSLNDVCVFVPVWFGVTATLFLGALTAEGSGSRSAGVFAALVMAVIPAHIMRSVGGGYDNESIAVTALCATFFLWCRALRGPRSWPWGLAAGAAYVYMVAAWGGFTFVLNMIVAHAFVLVCAGRFSPKLHKAYSLFYVVGTLGALQIPVIGWTPFKHAEQLAGLFAFAGLQLLAYCDATARRRELSRAESLALTARYVALAGAVVAGLLSVLIPMGYFAPLTTRVRSLFVRHTRTGNPLVDSVAEHQPSTADAYWAHLHYVCYAAPLGMLLLARRAVARGSDSAVFIMAYGATAYYFANKMNRLIILLGPASSALAGVALGAVFDWVVAQAVGLLLPEAAPAPAEAPRAAAGGAASPAPAAAAAAPAPAAGGPPATPVTKRKGAGKPGEKKAAAAARSSASASGSVLDELQAAILAPLTAAYNTPLIKGLRLLLAGALLLAAPSYAREFWSYSFMFAERQSHPSVVFKARLNTGELITVTDYLDGYNWLRENTPEDARVLSWWDYGYQITGIGNRTTLADGNTWSLEHISLLGKVLTSSEERSHKIMRHIADYVLIWAGGGGDDLAKSPHMARISASVFPSLCPGDPLCHNFGFYEHNGQHVPTPRMANCVLFKMSQHGSGGVEVNPELFREVYTSRYGKLRIFEVLNVDQESRAWLADPANRICDRPGSWYCVGQYPPKMPSKPPKTFTPIDVNKEAGGGFATAKAARKPIGKAKK
jgi:dolichyl-diphosphooligosaccharide--protein glycosyltransferase